VEIMTRYVSHGRILTMNKNLQKNRVKSGARFYFPDKLGSGAEVRLPADTAHHAIRTLRLGVGDPIVLFDGLGGEYEANICRIDRETVIARTGPFVDRSAETPVKLVLAQGISSGERMDFTIQKAVELGISVIEPLSTERSVVKLTPERALRRTSHWRKLAIAACEQSGRNRIVDIAEPQRLTDWLSQLPREGSDGELRLLLSPQADRGFKDFAEQVGCVILLVGPEGGLAPAEVATAQRWGFQSARMGPRVLRTETAALAALAAIQVRWGDF
jgi:16S rRNA (uracil1498-N3)-methyltransferase